MMSRPSSTGMVVTLGTLSATFLSTDLNSRVSVDSRAYSNRTLGLFGEALGGKRRSPFNLSPARREPAHRRGW